VTAGLERLALAVALGIGALAFPESSHATTYYVDADGGDDGNDGLTDAAPWKTLTFVMAQAFAPGDRILLKRGATWREEFTPAFVGEAGTPIVVGAYGAGDPPLITGADLATGWTSLGADVWSTDADTKPTVVLFDGVAGAEQDAVEDLASTHDWAWSGDVLYVHESDDPGLLYTAPGVEVSARFSAVDLDDSRFVRLEDLLLEAGRNSCAVWDGTGTAAAGGHELVSLEIRNCDTNGVWIEDSSDNIVQDCHIHAVGRVGISLWRTASEIGASRNEFAGNEIHDAANRGISLYGEAPELRVEDNVMRDNVIYDCGDAIYLDWAANNEIHHNELFDNVRTDSSGEGYGVGLQTASYTDIHDNVMYGNRNRGIEVHGGTGQYGNSDGNRIYRNVFHSHVATGDSYGVFFSSTETHDNEVFLNLIHGNSVGVMIGHPNSGNALYANVICGNTGTGIGLYGEASGWEIRNNVVCGSGIHEVWGHEGTDVTHDHNLYFGDQQELILYDGATYGAAEVADFEPTAVCADPQFVAQDGHDFHLLPTSPCIDAGADVGLSEDFEGGAVPYGASPDIGAYEWRPAGDDDDSAADDDDSATDDDDSAAGDDDSDGGEGSPADDDSSIDEQPGGDCACSADHDADVPVTVVAAVLLWAAAMRIRVRR